MSSQQPTDGMPLDYDANGTVLREKWMAPSDEWIEEAQRRTAETTPAR